jgi:hypothetical protein
MIKDYTFIEAYIGDIDPEAIDINGKVFVSQADCRADLPCPCGCGAIISLNLIPNIKPCWKVKLNNITPSINRNIGCKSHFSIVGGKVEWHNKQKNAK